MPRLLTVLVCAALGLATVGAEGCETETGGGSGGSKSNPDKRTEKRDADRRADRRTKAQARARARAKRRQAAPPASAPAEECDTNYAGACLDPSASDYDCEGGSGDGPEYTGIVRVVGDDHFDLDRDGDGTACDE